jgi:hypothetical protein
LNRRAIYGLSRAAVDDFAHSCMIDGEDAACLWGFSIIGMISATNDRMDLATRTTVVAFHTAAEARSRIRAREFIHV